MSTPAIEIVEDSHCGVITMSYLSGEVVDETAVGEAVLASLEDSESLSATIVYKTVGGSDISVEAEYTVAYCILNDAVIHGELGIEYFYGEWQGTTGVVAAVLECRPFHDIACAAAIEIDAAPLAWVTFIAEVVTVEPIALENYCVLFRASNATA